MLIVHMERIDLNLLSFAAALFRHKNASKAAAELGVSQSAVSHALTRLREAFDDPLFVRVARGLAPTALARSIEAELLDTVRRGDALFARRPSFEPARATGRVVIAATDYFEAVVMPDLWPRLSALAPDLQVSLRPTLGELPKRDLEDGRVDLAVAGFYRDLPDGFYQARLFSDEFAVAVRRDHPGVGKRLDRDGYFALRHALVTLQGDFRDRAAAGRGAKSRRRAIRYGSYSFTALAWTVERSDVALSAPSLLLRRYQERFAVRVLPCPVSLGTIDVRMIWHEQTRRDPLRAWVRSQVAETCASLRARSSASRPTATKG
jgi:DNA-binding transcriptional LysR family regulator